MQCQDYALERGLVVTHVYTDRGDPREFLDALLRDAVEHNTTDLIVSHLHRLGYEPRAYTRTREEFSAAGITLHSVREEAIMANPFLRNLARVLAATDPTGQHDEDDQAR